MPVEVVWRLFRALTAEALSVSLSGPLSQPPGVFVNGRQERLGWEGSDGIHYGPGV